MNEHEKTPHDQLNPINPAIQSGEYVGSRRKVENEVAATTWQNEKQFGLTENEIKTEGVIGAVGRFYRPKENKIDNFKVIKRKYKSKKASESANTHNLWIKYVKKCSENLQSFNNQILKPYFKITFPLIATSTITQMMYNATPDSVFPSLFGKIYSSFNEFADRYVFNQLIREEGFFNYQKRINEYTRDTNGDKNIPDPFIPRQVENPFDGWNIHYNEDEERLYYADFVEQLKENMNVTDEEYQKMTLIKKNLLSNLIINQIEIPQENVNENVNEIANENENEQINENEGFNENQNEEVNENENYGFENNIFEEEVQQNENQNQNMEIELPIEERNEINNRQNLLDNLPNSNYSSLLKRIIINNTNNLNEEIKDIDCIFPIFDFFDLKIDEEEIKVFFAFINQYFFENISKITFEFILNLFNNEFSNDIIDKLNFITNIVLWRKGPTGILPFKEDEKIYLIIDSNQQIDENNFFINDIIKNRGILITYILINGNLYLSSYYINKKSIFNYKIFKFNGYDNDEIDRINDIKEHWRNILSPTKFIIEEETNYTYENKINDNLLIAICTNILIISRKNKVTEQTLREKIPDFNEKCYEKISSYILYLITKQTDDNDLIVNKTRLTELIKISK